MGGHIVGAFLCMCVERVVLRDEACQPAFQVTPCRRIRILLDEKARRSMLYEKCAQPLRKAGTQYRARHLFGHFEEPLPARLNANSVDHFLPPCSACIDRLDQRRGRSDAHHPELMDGACRRDVKRAARGRRIRVVR